MKVNAGPDRANSANHIPPSFSVGSAPEKPELANWRMGRAWTAASCNLQESPTSSWSYDAKPPIHSDRREHRKEGPRLSPGSHLSQLSLTFLPENPNLQGPAFTQGCSCTPDSLCFLYALSFADSAWHKLCKGDGWLLHTCICLWHLYTAFYVRMYLNVQDMSIFKLKFTSAKATWWRSAFQINAFFLRREGPVFLLASTKQFLVWLCS